MCSINKHFTGIREVQSRASAPDVSILRFRHCSLKNKALVSEHVTEFIDFVIWRHV